MIEALIGSIFMAAMIPTLLLTMYLGFSKMWINHVTEESLLCLASTDSSHSCKKKYTKYIGKALPVGRLEEFDLVKSTNHARVEIRFNVHNNIKLAEKKSIRLPLKAQQI